MLPLLTDFGVPTAIAFLMLVAGTEIMAVDITTAVRHPRALLLGAIGQLAFLPPMALLISAAYSSIPAISFGMLSLALSPGGGISNLYCYLARRNVSLSASITAFGTVLSLITIPVWMKVLQTFVGTSAGIRAVPMSTILLQLFALMILPMAGGMLLRKVCPNQVETSGTLLRKISLAFVLLVLILTISATQESAVLAPSLLIGAMFILGAMLCGWMSGFQLTAAERDVLVIESGVRNIGVALTLGRLLLPLEAFGEMASFFAGYFTVEIMIMLALTSYLSAKRR
ncbi:MULTISPECIES: bile acid:sodium symporter family protein [unclassified Hyphomicrobium]|uniref:bile acid:sodium symporter family protein n=1 Tax=unclassified Hyphomicrobium TaxID=2619925 RepID=UPI000213F68D|nr:MULTISPECIES: bile acid:sodium symporter [unclassified Hyphomicrobium]CCB64954.1 putative Similar to tr/Q8YLP2/Q8YLP2 [Hyphomicrobium sp. MC1]